MMTSRHAPLLDIHALSSVRVVRVCAKEGESRADLSSLVCMVVIGDRLLANCRASVTVASALAQYRTYTVLVPSRLSGTVATIALLIT